MTAFFQGTSALLTVQWYEFAGGPGSDVSAQTVTVRRLSDLVDVVGPTAVGITHVALGLYTFTWTIAPTEIPGDYAVIWNATDFQLDPVQTSEIVTVRSSAGGAPGSCGWDINVTCCTAFWNTLTPDEQAVATSYATIALWARTGRQYGTCPITVRPCGRYCNDDGIGGWYWSAGAWMPYVLDGLWYNCACPGACSCEPRCRVYLPGPVASVISVTVDGVLIDPATYRVDNEGWLIRTGAGNCWPERQDYDVDSGPGSFIVVYERGTQPPAALLAGAGTLACEYAKACRNVACRLPAYIVSLSRQGTDFQAADPITLLENGFTGLWEVDGLIRDLNPYQLAGRPRLRYPGDDFPRMTTVP
jgi:hypothetical protein